MIIECKKCHSTFNFDENLLNESGSTVRCSICQHVFTAFPSKVKPDLDKTIVTEALEGIGQGEEEGIEAISFEDISQLDGGFFKEHEEKEAEIDIDEAFDRAEQDDDRIQAREEGEREEKIEEVEESAEPQPVFKKRRRSALWITIWLIALLLVGSAAALFVLKPDLLLESLPSFKKPLSKEQVFDMGNKRLSIKRDPADLKGSFVDSEKGGKLFVVSGLITNNYPDNRSFIRVRSNILDSKGKVVTSKIAYAGNTFSDKELLPLSIVEIDNSLNNKFGKDKVNTNILPNSSIPFMIIFSDLPEDISEFSVEPISSFSAKK